MNVAEMWGALEAEASKQGEFRRRIHPESAANLYLVVHKPDNTRALLIDVDLSGAEALDLPSGRGIDLRWVPTEAGGDALELVLSQPAFADLFDALVTDVAAAGAAGTGQQDVAARVAARVRRWQIFLRESPAGLSLERQRGLYGELYFLRYLLLPAISPQPAAEAWVGPYQAHQDFTFGPAAVEVKTTIANQHQVLRIASERQLDTTGLTSLAVFHLSVDGREGAGQTLPDLVLDLRKQFEDSGGSDLFEEALFAGGFLDAQSSAYRTGYTIREANIFLVAGEFPRLVESNCPVGVGDVAYSIAVSALSVYRIESHELFQLLGDADGS